MFFIDSEKIYVEIDIDDVKHAIFVKLKEKGLFAYFQYFKHMFLEFFVEEQMTDLGYDTCGYHPHGDTLIFRASLPKEKSIKDLKNDIDQVIKDFINKEVKQFSEEHELENDSGV